MAFTVEKVMIKKLAMQGNSFLPYFILTLDFYNVKINKSHLIFLQFSVEVKNIHQSKLIALKTWFSKGEKK